MKVRNPHECLETEWTNNPAVSVRLQEALDENLLPPCYHTHPVVVASLEPVLPCALYMDGVAYTNTDSVLGIWLVNCITGVRHTLALIRKKMTCRCGCRGWCTYWPVLFWLHWCCLALARGENPFDRHDELPWKTSDAFRLATRGVKLNFKRAAIIYSKGDLAEFCDRYAFPSWNSNIRPCFLCNGFGPGLFLHLGWSSDACPSRLNVDADFELACQRCEITVTITNDTFELFTF